MFVIHKEYHDALVEHLTFCLYNEVDVEAVKRLLKPLMSSIDEDIPSNNLMDT